MRYVKTRLYGMRMLKKDVFQKILTSNLGLNSDEIKQFVDMNNKTITYSRHRLINNCQLCRIHKVEVKPLEHFGYCLKLLPHTLEHRINMLKDIGVQKLNVTLISKLYESPTDMSLLNLNNEIKIKEYYNKCYLFCKTQIFNLPNLDNEILLKGELKNKSISMIAEMLKILRLDLGFINKYIEKNPKIITASPENVKSLLNNFKDTGLVGLPIETVLKKHSYLLFEDANNIKHLLQLFEHYEIPEDYVHKFMKIFTLGSDVFLERMTMIMKHPDLQLWHKYPRILQLILYKNMAMDRVEYLRYINRIKWARAHTVLSQTKTMDRFLQYGSSTLMSQKPLRYLLNTKLKIPLTNVEVVKKLMKHPHWKTAGFHDIGKMLDYLMENFTVDEICANIHIVLYSRSVIEELLADLRKKYSQSTEYSFTNRQYLALCLYMIEKDTHFTGDGIWNKGHNTQKQSSCLSKN
ncbi:transcription termination factor 5, mitochondrial isoform X2 [Harpegnathos saltator]|uniref:transcription termination factor 5, mitochondrial isoform X2 n=1 Tax=Harpegnathos saltator TaxID=610380 RepID=UPI000948C00C|nr:transcription termination factor 5, mitochondrial isoform X2 [Harpegnathos saltator]